MGQEDAEMMLKSGGWASGQYLTIVEQTDAYQVVRVDVPNRTGMRTVGYQYRTSVGVEHFKRLREIREAHPKEDARMIKVNAPEGYEGLRYYDDAVREWRVSVRRVGEKFWTNVGLAGHTHLTAETLDSRSEKIIADAVAIGRVP